MEKGFYRLWYEYLKRSDNYRDFIKGNRPITKVIRNPVNCSNRWGGKDPVLLGHSLNLWRFGDVFKVPFESWYKREPKPFIAVETKDYLTWFDRQLELQDKAYCKSMGLPYLPGKGLMATVESKSIWEHPNVLKRLMETPPNLQIMNISVNITATDKEIRDTVMRLVNQRKKKAIPALESLHDYLLTHDKFQEGLSEMDVAKAIFPKFIEGSEGNQLSHNETINRIRLYHKNACTIIRNVEAGNIYFPGKY